MTISGKTYYCWDMDNNGTCTSAGDYRNHDVLDAFFNKDVNGVACGSGNTTDSCRYVNAADAGGRKLALIPAGGTAPASGSQGCPGSPVSDSLCGIRAASGDKAPSGWANVYWSSTEGSSAVRHYYLNQSNGSVGDNHDSVNYYVAVQVF